MFHKSIVKLKDMYLFEVLTNKYNQLVNLKNLVKTFIKGDSVEDLIEIINLSKERLGINAVVDRNDYRIDDNYYGTVDNIWEEIRDYPDNIYVDKKMWVENEVDFNNFHPNTTVEEIDYIISNSYDYDIEDIIVHMTGVEKYSDSYYYIIEAEAEDIENEYPELYAELIQIGKEVFNNNDFYDFVETDFLSLYGIDYPEERFNEHEELAYWTVYFEPYRMDKDIAYECNLFPFEYSRDAYGYQDLLALAASGMDLSPKLDAYQALVDGSLPSDSRFFDDSDYAEYVVGKKTAEKVLKAAKSSPTITIRTY